MPGMTTPAIRRPSRALPPIEFRRVGAGATLDDFRALGSNCFHVPPGWFAEVFDESLMERPFVCWVGYAEGIPVTTAASVTAEGVAGIYNIATTPVPGKGIR